MRPFVKINQSIKTFARAPVTDDHWRRTSNPIKLIDKSKIFHCCETSESVTDAYIALQNVHSTHDQRHKKTLSCDTYCCYRI